METRFTLVLFLFLALAVFGCSQVSQGSINSENNTGSTDKTTDAGTYKKPAESRLKVIWGNFTLAKNTFDDDMWQMDIEVKNTGNKKVILDVIGNGKNMNWGWRVQDSIRGFETKELELEIDHHFFDEVAFDKKNVTINAYECSELPQKIEEKLCIDNYGFEGRPSPWEIIRQSRKTGSKIKPTFVETKYFNFDSLENPPREITREEYLSSG